MQTMRKMGKLSNNLFPSLDIRIVNETSEGKIYFQLLAQIITSMKKWTLIGFNISNGIWSTDLHLQQSGSIGKRTFCFGFTEVTIHQFIDQVGHFKGFDIKSKTSHIKSLDDISITIANIDPLLRIEIMNDSK